MHKTSRLSTEKGYHVPGEAKEQQRPDLHTAFLRIRCCLRPLRRGRKQFTIDAHSDYMPALDHQLQALLDTGVVRTQMELAELTELTIARITQIMNLLILAPDLPEEILFMQP